MKPISAEKQLCKMVRLGLKTELETRVFIGGVKCGWRVLTLESIISWGKFMSSFCLFEILRAR